jgi:hypothetical protein
MQHIKQSVKSQYGVLHRSRPGQASHQAGTNSIFVWRKCPKWNAIKKDKKIILVGGSLVSVCDRIEVDIEDNKASV